MKGERGKEKMHNELYQIPTPYAFVLGKTISRDWE